MDPVTEEMVKKESGVGDVQALAEVLLEDLKRPPDGVIRKENYLRASTVRLLAAFVRTEHAFEQLDDLLAHPDVSIAEKLKALGHKAKHAENVINIAKQLAEIAQAVESERRANGITGAMAPPGTRLAPTILLK